MREIRCQLGGTKRQGNRGKQRTGQVQCAGVLDGQRAIKGDKARRTRKGYKVQGERRKRRQEKYNVQGFAGEQGREEGKREKKEGRKGTMYKEEKREGDGKGTMYRGWGTRFL